MTTPKTQFPIARSEAFAPLVEVHPEAPAKREARLPSSAQVGLIFLLLTVVGFVALGAVLPHYTLSNTARHGLTYDTLFAELHDALIDEPDRPLRRAIRAVQVDALVPAPNGYTVVTYDTLSADPSVYPSLEAGGFLHDEIDRFNGYQRERLDAVRRGHLTGGTVMDLRAAENPSIFRTEIRSLDDARGERDSIVLAERAVPYGLRVPSPFDAARLVAVTTREWSRSLGWLSAKGAQSVRSAGKVPGVPPCPFRAVKDSVYVECTAPGSPFAQLVLRFPDRLGETGTATLFTGERTLYDGKQLPSRRTVPIGTGGMFQFHSRALSSARRTRPEPVILEWTLAGTLGGTQWINGRIRWEPSVSRTSPLVRQLASAAGFGASVELEAGRNIPLSLDEGLTDDLQAELDDFAGHGKHGPSHMQTSDLAFATVVLASAKTGEILGVAEYGPPAASGGSWLLKPVNVGSAIKPLLAAATLMERPELATLEVRNDAMTMHDVWGLPLGKPFESGASCPLGWIGLRQFLSCSSNRYSASLVAAALQPAASRGTPELESAPGVSFRLGGQTHVGQRLHLPLDRNHQIRADTLNGSALAEGLFTLDSLNTSLELAAQLGREGRDSSVWLHLRDDRFNPVRVPLGLWPEQSRLAMMRGNRPATARQLAMFSVGAAENRVTTLDLTQAFARIVTDRRFALTFVPNSSGQASFPSLELSKYSWYPAFIGGLHDVGTTGTAKGTQAAIAQQLSTSLLFFGKSGTLNAPPHVRVLRRTDTVMVNGAPVTRPLTFVDTVVPPVVAKTLLFAIGAKYSRSGKTLDTGKVKQQEGNGGAIDCGIVGTIYFRLRRNPPHVESLATDFANERLWRLLRKDWQRLKVC
ncbi:MAG TPA: hypothetical protein VGH98_17905 [Gemmatimonadaceae bacterium]|jgi:hypothetical protein